MLATGRMAIARHIEEARRMVTEQKGHRRQLHAGCRENPRRSRGDRDTVLATTLKQSDIERLYMLRRDLLFIHPLL
jgi:hypothetical protein